MEAIESESPEETEKRLLVDGDQALLLLLNRYIRDEELKGVLLEDPSISLHSELSLKGDYNEVLASFQASGDVLSEEERIDRIKNISEAWSLNKVRTNPSSCYLKEGDRYIPLLGSPEVIIPYVETLPAGVANKTPLVFRFSYFPLVFTTEERAEGEFSVYYPLSLKLEGYKTGQVTRAAFFEHLFEHLKLRDPFNISLSAKIEAKLEMKAELTVVPSSTLIAKNELFEKYFLTPTNKPSRSLYSLFARPGKVDPKEVIVVERPTGEKNGDLSDKFEVFRIVPICKDPEFQAYVVANGSLFASIPQWQEDELSEYIRKVFGVKGFKVLMSVLNIMDEQFACSSNGKAILELNEIMKGAGYSQGKNRAYKTTDRVQVIKILDIILSTEFRTLSKENKTIRWEEAPLFLTLKRSGEATEKRSTSIAIKDSNGEIIAHEPRFVPDRIRREIQANPIWYSDSFKNTSGRAPQYTLIPKLLCALPDNREIAIRLGWLFYIDWRLNSKIGYNSYSVSTLLERANLKRIGKNAGRDREKLFAELPRMKEEGLIGNFDYEQRSKDDPLKDIIRIYPPEEIGKVIGRIGEGRRLLERKPNETPKPISEEEFFIAIKKSGLGNSAIARLFGVSPSLVTLWMRKRTGKKEGTSPSLHDRAKARETLSQWL